MRVEAVAPQRVGEVAEKPQDVGTHRSKGGAVHPIPAEGKVDIRGREVQPARRRPEEDDRGAGLASLGEELL